MHRSKPDSVSSSKDQRCHTRRMIAVGVDQGALIFAKQGFNVSIKPPDTPILSLVVSGHARLVAMRLRSRDRLVETEMIDFSFAQLL
jgi:hypothetical protein